MPVFEWEERNELYSRRKVYRVHGKNEERKFSADIEFDLIIIRNREPFIF